MNKISSQSSIGFSTNKELEGQTNGAPPSSSPPTPTKGKFSEKLAADNRRRVNQYYIDELGFYRHLDLDQNQYVCSNLDRTNLRRPSRDKSAPQEGELELSSGNSKNYEICFRAIRSELGISHFDRTVDHASWKKEWDDFMRAKLTKQEPVTLNSELKLRVRSGIPHDYRCKVWTALIRMRTKAIRAKVGNDIYQNILQIINSEVGIPEYSSTADDLNNNIQRHKKQASSYVTPLITNSNSNSDTKLFNLNVSLLDKCFRQIELDLLRTLPNNRHFDDPNSRGVQRVRRVLRAYACFNQTVGYCQGMNRLAAMALLVLPEEEAFWCLVAIIQCIMPKDYYLKPWLAQVDCNVLNDLLEKKMPKLHKHLVSNDIQLTLFTWFFTIFVDGFRPELMLRIWDCLLLEGDKVLFRFALSILQITQNDLLEMNDFSTMNSHLSKLVSTRRLDMEQLFELTFKDMNGVSEGFLRSRREYHRNRMQASMDD